MNRVDYMELVHLAKYKNITKIRALCSRGISLLDIVCMKVTDWKTCPVCKQNEDSRYSTLRNVQYVE